MHRTAPTTKNYPAQNVNSAAAEKQRFTLNTLLNTLQTIIVQSVFLGALGALSKWFRGQGLVGSYGVLRLYRPPLQSVQDGINLTSQKLLCTLANQAGWSPHSTLDKKNHSSKERGLLKTRAEGC